MHDCRIQKQVPHVKKQQCLTSDEYNGLTRIAQATKMDCWFFIKQKNGVDCIYDLETGKYLNFANGLSQLAEGITDPLPQLGLTSEETSAVKELFIKNGIWFLDILSGG